MKKLALPSVDDVSCTKKVADNERLKKTSYPHLKNALKSVLDSYTHYNKENGNALKIGSIPISEKLKSGLLKNYSSKLPVLAYIAEIRRSSPLVCPMCGAPKTTSLDHVLPKEDYPEFSIFSKNLVPACDCNEKRGRNTKDTKLNARVLHPYFDACLSNRILSCAITPSPDLPMVKIEVVYVHAPRAMLASLEFHVDKVVKPSGLVNWLENKWTSTCTSPSSVIHTMPRSRVISEDELKDCIQDALERSDESYGTPNNWFSIFFHGLINSPGIVLYLVDKHNEAFP